MSLSFDKGEFKVPKCYVISLVRREDRRTKVAERLTRRNLKFEFIDACDKDSERVKYYSWNSSHLNNMGNFNKFGEFGCFASHLKALKKFLDSGDSHGIIFEDDVTLHKNWNKLIMMTLGTMGDTPLVMLCVSHPTYYKEMLNREGKIFGGAPLLFPINRIHCWGTLGYIISRKYALESLKMYDRPFYLIDPINRFPHIQNRVTSELITMNSKGAFVYPPLVIESPTASDINQNNPQRHQQMFSTFKPQDYD